MAETPHREPEQLAMMRRVVELAEEQTLQSAQRTEQSAERSYMNAERTLSVWTRTALSLMIFGIAVDRFGLLLRHEPWPHLGGPLLPNPVSTLGGAVLVALGVLMAITCGVRYLVYALDWGRVHAWPKQHAPWLAFSFAMLVAAFGIALLVVLLVFTG
ncbi:MAG: YidH family protein [Rhodanobacteraceae bacterium]